MTGPDPGPQVLLRLVAAGAAAAATFVGAFAFALAGCHSSGGFCAGEFNSGNVVLYAVGTFLLSSAAGLLTWAVTRMRTGSCAVAGGAALALLVVAVVSET